MQRVLLISEAETAQLSNARPVALRTSAELLSCRNLALLPFAESDEAVETAGNS